MTKETSEKAPRFQLVFDPYSTTVAQLAAILNLLAVQIDEGTYATLTPPLQKLFLRCE